MAILVGTPARIPKATPAFSPRSLRVCAVQPIFVAIDVTARQQDA